MVYVCAIYALGIVVIEIIALLICENLISRLQLQLQCSDWTESEILSDLTIFKDLITKMSFLF